MVFALMGSEPTTGFLLPKIKNLDENAQAEASASIGLRPTRREHDMIANSDILSDLHFKRNT